MSLALLFVLMALAAFRITRLLVADTLPLVAAPREWLLTRWNPKCRPLPKQDKVSSWSDLVTCSWCMGVYVSAGVVALTTRYASVPLPGLQCGAVAAVVGLLSVIDEG